MLGLHSSHGLHHAISRQQLTNALGKDLIDDAAGSGVHVPDDPAPASDMVEENDPIPKYSQPVKALQFAFERPDVSFFVLQILETAPDGLADVREKSGQSSNETRRM